MAAIAPPFRADHIGSLKRPDALLELRAKFDNGSCSRDELKKVEDESIKQIVAMQKSAGIKSVTDGEFRRSAPLFSLVALGELRADSRSRFCSAQAHVLR